MYKYSYGKERLSLTAVAAFHENFSLVLLYVAICPSQSASSFYYVKLG